MFFEPSSPHERTGGGGTRERGTVENGFERILKNIRSGFASLGGTKQRSEQGEIGGQGLISRCPLGQPFTLGKKFTLLCGRRSEDLQQDSRG
jgi:hypothetical protein